MGVGYYTCNWCGENFSDCGYYVSCESCGTRWCSDECAREDGYIKGHCKKHPELENVDMMEHFRDEHCNCDYCCDCEYYEPDSCKYCRKEDYDDNFLLCKALLLLDISREDLINMINSEDT